LFKAFQDHPKKWYGRVLSYNDPQALLDRISYVMDLRWKVIQAFASITSERLTDMKNSKIVDAKFGKTDIKSEDLIRYVNLKQDLIAEKLSKELIKLVPSEEFVPADMVSMKDVNVVGWRRALQSTIKRTLLANYGKPEDPLSEETPRTKEEMDDSKEAIPSKMTSSQRDRFKASAIKLSLEQQKAYEFCAQLLLNGSFTTEDDKNLVLLKENPEKIADFLASLTSRKAEDEKTWKSEVKEGVPSISLTCRNWLAGITYPVVAE